MKTAIRSLAVVFGLAVLPAAHADRFGDPGWQSFRSYDRPDPPHGMPSHQDHTKNRKAQSYDPPDPPHGMPAFRQPPRLQPPPFSGVTPAPHRMPVRVPPPPPNPLPQGEEE